MKPEDATPAGMPPVDRPVGRPGDARKKRMQATPEGRAALDAGKRMVENAIAQTLGRGCPECAWGKVLGCWRCGGR